MDTADKILVTNITTSNSIRLKPVDRDRVSNISCNLLCMFSHSPIYIWSFLQTSLLHIFALKSSSFSETGVLIHLTVNLEGLAVSTVKLL